MARTVVEHTILLKTGSDGVPKRVEYLAAAAIAPGEICEIAAGPLVQLHATADGPMIPYVAVEQAWPDTHGHPLVAAIDMEYDAGETVALIQPRIGDVVLAFIGAAEAVVEGVTFLESDGNGHLDAVVPDAADLVGAVKFIADETVDNSGGGTPVRCRVRRI